MNWKAMTATAVLGACAGSAAATDTLQQQGLFHDPTARAYLSVGFDLAAGVERPLHYGLRMDTGNARDWFQQPAFARIDFDRAGLTTATVSGLPLVQRDPALYADGELVYNWADFAWLAVGAVGLGYVIYELADSDSGSRPQPSDDNGNDNGNGDNGDNGGGLLGGGLLGGGLLGGGLVGDPAYGGMSQRDYRKWRDGGTGQMGDLD